jgi:hypothetical protein
MARIVDNTFKDWKDNDLVRSSDYKQEREIIRVALNDNYDRLLKKYDKEEIDGFLSSIKGNGWTIQTIKDNYDMIQDILETHYPADVIEVKLSDMMDLLTSGDSNLQAQVDDNRADINSLQVNFATKNELNTETQQLQGLSDQQGNRLDTYEGRLTSAELDINDRYTKAQTDAKVTYVQSQIDNLNDVYSTDAERIAAINNIINQFEIADDDLASLIQNKANVSDVYSQAEVEQRLINKADSSNVYTRADTHTLLANKTDKTGNHDGTWKGLLPPNIGAGDMNASRITYLEEQVGNQERNTQTLQTGVSILDGEANAPATFQLEGKTLTSLGNSDLEDSKYYVLADKNTKVKTFKEDTPKQGVAKFQRGQSLTSVADFKGKISGSAVENPHLAKYLINASRLDPAIGTEVNSANLPFLQALDGSIYAFSSTTNTAMCQTRFSFNVIEQIERKHGLIPKTTIADKVKWVKDNLNKLTCNWHGYGSSPSGNKATLAAWRSDTNSWYADVSHSNNSITKITRPLNTIGDFNVTIQSDGIVHFLVHAEPSDGVTQSFIATDFVDLELELKTTAVLDKRPILSRIATFEGKVSGSTVENPHVMNYSSKSTLAIPSEGLEMPQTIYDRSTKLGDTPLAITSQSNNGGVSQQIFSINIVEEIERKLGKIPKPTLADKVQWCKDNVVKLTGNWHGYGSSPTGNKANSKVWSNSSSAWGYNNGSHTNGTVTKLYIPRTVPTEIADMINSNGIYYVLAYAEPSDGVTPSAINTDYFSCDIELKPGAELWHPSVPLYEVQQYEYDKILVDWMESDVLNRYPRAQGSQHVQNPYVMAEGENLLPPFYEWVTHNNVKILDSYEFEHTSTSVGQQSYVLIPVKENQVYYASFDLNGESIVYFQYLDSNKTLLGNGLTLFTPSALSGTFTTPVGCRFVKILPSTRRASGVALFKNPMLTLGSEPKPFVPRNPSYLFAETKLGSIGDKKDILFYEDGTYKRRKVVEKDLVLDGSLELGYSTDYTGYKRIYAPINSIVNDANLSSVVKFNGKSFKGYKQWTDADQMNVTSGNLYLSVSDTDTGWGETYTPTANDVKRYFNGWKYTDGVTWASVTGNGQTADGTTALGTKPSDYTPYKLSYVLAAPKTEAVMSEGAITVNGKTQVEVGSGVVVREKATVGSSVTQKWINNSTQSSELHMKLKSFVAIYKNGASVTEDWEIYNFSGSYGNLSARIDNSKFDSSAEYTVTYLVLDKHLFTSNPNDVKATYSRNLRDAHDDLAKRYEDTATKVSVLDRTVYELLIWKLKHESEGGV